MDETPVPLRRYFRGLLLGCLGPLLGVALLNLGVDPFRVYHAGWKQAPYPRDARQLVPGLIRTASYDGIIAGTSHCDNFLPSSIEQRLGWNALRITLPGSDFAQQRAAVQLALDTRQVRHVLWGLDLFAFYCNPDLTQSTTQDFPVEFYRPSVRRPLNYLLNLDTARHSFRMLCGRGDRSLEHRGTWFTKYEFSEAAALQQARPQLWKAWQMRVAQQALGWSAVQLNLEQELESLIRAHPEVEFRLLLPPISGLGYLPDFFGDGSGFRERLRFRAQLCERLAAYPNARLYDFEVATEYTHDLARYMDLTHFDRDINEWMLERIAADEYRLTPDTLAEHQRHFATATTTFLTPVLAGEHPWAALLDLDRFPHADAQRSQLLAAGRETVQMR